MRTRTQRAEKRTTMSPSFLGKFERLQFNADPDARACGCLLDRQGGPRCEQKRSRWRI